MRPVSDPTTLAMLNDSQPAARSPVTDPNIIGQLEYGIDFNQPDDAVRSALSKLPTETRGKALDTWADAYVARERSKGGVGMALDNTARTLARGTIVGPFLDEITAAASNPAAAARAAVSGQDDPGSAPYYEGLAYQRARDRAVDTDYPVLSTTAQLATGLGTGVAAMRGGGGVIGGLVAGPVAAAAPAASASGRIGQAAGVGAGYGAASGFGNSQGGAGNRAEGAVTGAGFGAALGGALGSGAETVRGVQRAYARTGETGAYDQFARQLGDTTVEQFADDVATGATRQQAPLNRRTLDILGEEMVQSGDNAQVAAQRAIQRLVAEHGVSPTTARDQIRRLTGIHRDSPLMMGEYPAVAESNRATRMARPDNVEFAEASQITNAGTQDTIDYLANSGAGRAVQQTRNAIEDRQSGLQDWFRGRLETMAPGGRTLDDAENMIAGIRRQAQQEYDAVYNGAGGTAVNNRMMHGLMQRMVDRHLNRMVGRSGEQAQALRSAIDELFIDLPNGQRLVMPSLQQAQDMRGSIRGMIERAERAGNRHIASTLQPLYRDMTRIMERSSPGWAQANQRWAGMVRLEDALDFGQRLTPKAGPAQREALREFTRLAPEAQDLVRVGWLQQQFDKLASMRDTHDVSKMFDKQEMFNLVERMFTRRDAVQFARYVRDAEVANRSTRMLGNSATHRRGMLQRSMDAETGIVAAAENASMSGVRNWLVERLTGLLRDRRNVPLARISTTPMRDTAAVAGNITRMRTAQERLRQIDRPARDRVPAAASFGQQAGGQFSEDDR